MSRKPPEPAEFDRFAGDYDALLQDPLRDRFAGEKGFFVERKLDVIRAFLRSRNVDSRRLSWLDVGCGRGELLRLGEPHFASVSGCDPSAGMLDACRGLNVRHQAAIEALPFPASSFDFISVVCVYHHVSQEERRAFTAALLNALRPGGILCVVEHNPFNPATRIIVSRTPVDADAHLLNARHVRRLMSRVGLEPLSTRYFLFLPEGLFRVMPAVENAFSVVPFGGQYAVFARRV
jgi:SAM-dependent methyltransferase